MADFDALNSGWTSELPQNVDSACSIFASLFLKSVNKHIPTKCVSGQPLPPWLPHSLLHKIHQRCSLYHRAVASNFPQMFSQYRSLCNAISANIKCLKSSFFNTVSQVPQRFWAYVRSLRRSKAPVPSLQSADGSLLSNDLEKAKSLNNAFSSFFSPPSLPPNIPPLDSSAVCPEDLLCSQQSIVHLISQLPVHTAPGPDDIHSVLLKATAHSICHPLQIIFNLSISSGSFPSQWKNSSVVSIPTTSPPSTSPTNFRPISLLSLISKLLEKHIFNIVLYHLHSNNFLSDS